MSGSGTDLKEDTLDGSSLTSVPVLGSEKPNAAGPGAQGKPEGAGGPPSGGGPGGPGGPGGRGGGPPPPHVLARIGMKALARNATILFLVIWCAAMWLYASNSGAQNRVSNLKVLVRDFDGSEFGEALLAAVNSLNGQKTLPTFVISTDASMADMHDKVFDGTYWASISANSGVTATFNETVAGTLAASSYNASSVFTYHAASVRYYTSYVSYVYPGVMSVLNLAQQTANTYAATVAAGTSSLSSEQIAIVGNSAKYTFNDVAPLPFQSRVFLNTFGIVISHLSQFFFNMILNGIFLGVGIYRNTTFLRLIKRKYPIKVLWTLLTSLTIASFPIITKDGFNVTAKDFFALWAAEWVYAIINFNTIATVLVFLPLPFMTMFVFPWVVTSIAAATTPIELSNVFYRISYIFPSHAYWNTVMTAYGHGAINRLYIYLPILAAWIVVTEIAWLFADVTLAKRSTKPPPARPGA